MPLNAFRCLPLPSRNPHTVLGNKRGPRRSYFLTSDKRNAHMQPALSSSSTLRNLIMGLKPFIWISQKLEGVRRSAAQTPVTPSSITARRQRALHFKKYTRAEDNICPWERKGKKGVFKEGKTCGLGREGALVREERLHLQNKSNKISNRMWFR